MGSTVTSPSWRSWRGWPGQARPRGRLYEFVMFEWGDIYCSEIEPLTSLALRRALPDRRSAGVEWRQHDAGTDNATRKARRVGGDGCAERGGRRRLCPARRELGLCRAMAAREPRPRCAGPFLLAPRQHEEADRRAGDRQHLCARPDGDGQWTARPRRAVGRAVSARHRRVACAVGRGRAWPYLRQAGDDDALLSRGDARGALW